MLTEASVDRATPDVLAQKLSIFTKREFSEMLQFSEAEMLPYAHAWLDLPDDDPRGKSSTWRFSVNTRRLRTP